MCVLGILKVQKSIDVKRQSKPRKSPKRCNKTLDWVEIVTGIKFKKVKSSY